MLAKAHLRSIGSCIRSGHSTMIFIAGATGYIGGRLLDRLRDRSTPIRCLARSPEKLRHLADDQVSVVEGDVLEPDTLGPALEGVETAYYLIHSMGAGGEFKDRDARGARNFARAAANAGVDRIIYLGGLVRDEDAELSEHLESRKEVGQILASTGIPVTELRASIIIGAGSASFEIIRDLVDKLPLMITPKWVCSRCEPIAVDDVIEYLVACLDTPETAGETLEIGCGEVLTYAEMMQVVADVMGRSVYMVTVPVLTPRLSAYWLNLITSVPMQVAYPLVDGLRNDSFCRDTRIRTMIPRELTSFRDAVQNAIRQTSEGVIASRWTGASISEAGWEGGPDRVTDPLRDRQVLSTEASPSAVFDVLSRIGGQNGYYFADFLWTFRGLLDRLLGGPGLRRGRRDPDTLRSGDAIDFWRVEGVEEHRYLCLRAEMKLPGTAWLEFVLEPQSGGGTQLRQEATFAVDSLWGYLYWFLMLPAHVFIFRNMAQEIVRRAEQGHR